MPTSTAIELHVAPTGHDQNPGTAERPLATPAGARDRLRQLRAAAPADARPAATVWLHAGDYELRVPLVFEAIDSGAAGAGVAYRACPGEVVRLSGGRRVEPGAFVPLRDLELRRRLSPQAREAVVELDMAAAGLTELGEAVPRGFWFGHTPAEPELFCDDRPLPQSRWPREGYARVGRVLDPGTLQGEPNPRGAVFASDPQRVRLWSREKSLRCLGFWKHPWSPATQPVGRLDRDQGLIGFATHSHYGVEEGKPYCVLNAVEEIARPGDWALDREAGVLYVFPTPGWRSARLVVSQLPGPIVELRDASHLTLQGLIIESGRGIGVNITGRDNLLAGCTLRNLGGRAAYVEGARNGLLSCDIHDTGQGGIYLGGGDRRTLTPGGNWAQNNDIHHFNRISLTYNPGINFAGVGQRASHNHIHHGPHNGILLWGNDHLIEFNEFDHLATDTDDAAAIYMGRNPSEQGNVIAHNFFHHIGAPSAWGTSAVYPDDGESGFVIRGNVFYRCGHAGQVSMGAIFNNAGKDHLVEQNLFLDCALGMGHSFPTQAQWERMVARENSGHLEIHDAIYKTVDIDAEPYRSRYPHLADLASNACRNTLRGNLTVRCGRLVTPEERQVLIDNHEIDADPGFVDLDRLDLRFRDPAAAAARFKGFTPPPFERMGLQADALRPAVPPRDWMDCRVEVLERPVASGAGASAKARLAVRLTNHTPRRFTGEVECWTTAPECVTLPAGGVVAFDLEPGGVGAVELEVGVVARPDVRMAVGARVRGDRFGLTTPLRPVYRVSVARREGLPALAQLAGALAGEPELRFLRGSDVKGSLRLALDGQRLALHARVGDERIGPASPHWPDAENSWGGPYLGLLVAPADARSTRAVHQVVLFPHAPAPSGVAWRFVGPEQVEPGPIERAFTPLEGGGYEVSALIPLASLGLAGSVVSFRLEAMINLPGPSGQGIATSTLFGSRTAQLELETLARCDVE